MLLPAEFKRYMLTPLGDHMRIPYNGLRRVHMDACRLHLRLLASFLTWDGR